MTPERLAADGPAEPMNQAILRHVEFLTSRRVFVDEGGIGVAMGLDGALARVDIAESVRRDYGPAEVAVLVCAVLREAERAVVAALNELPEGQHDAH